MHNDAQRDSPYDAFVERNTCEKGVHKMDQKIIDFPTYAALRRPWAKVTLPQETEVVEMTMTIPKAEPGPSNVRY